MCLRAEKVWDVDLGGRGRNLLSVNTAAQMKDFSLREWKINRRGATAGLKNK